MNDELRIGHYVQAIACAVGALLGHALTRPITSDNFKWTAGMLAGIGCMWLSETSGDYLAAWMQAKGRPDAVCRHDDGWDTP